MQPRLPHDSGQPTPGPGYVGRRRTGDNLGQPADYLHSRAPQPGPLYQPPVPPQPSYPAHDQPVAPDPHRARELHGPVHGDHGEHDGDHGDHHGDHDDHSYDHDGDDRFFDDEHYRSPAKRRRGAFIAVVSALIVVVLAVGGFVVIRNVISGFGGDGGPAEYSGSGGEPVTVVIPAGATTTDIATLLDEADVVASASLFLDAAAANPAATSIQPGTYQLQTKLSSAAALAMLLDPGSRSVLKVVVPEGYRIDQVLAAIADVLKLDPAAVQAAAADRSQVPLPAGFEGAPSLEGMLFPATYDFGPGATAAQALNAMTAKFTQVVGETGFVAKAQGMGLTPYDALKVASMAEAEAANFADWSKVARVIYNRTANGEPLGIDATSLYEARIEGRDPLDIDYEAPTPYNTRRTPGLPPTPIGNPGQEAMRAAVEPAAGPWLYYVVTDANGGMSFTDNYSQFEVWAAECRRNSWANC